MPMQWYEYAKTLSKGRYTLEDIGRATGVTYSAAGHWLSGRSEPSLDQIRIIADLLGVSVCELIEGGPVEARNTALSSDEKAVLEAFKNLGSNDRKKALRIIRSIAD